MFYHCTVEDVFLISFQIYAGLQLFQCLDFQCFNSLHRVVLQSSIYRPKSSEMTFLNIGFAHVWRYTLCSVPYVNIWAANYLHRFMGIFYLTTCSFDFTNMVLAGWWEPAYFLSKGWNYLGSNLAPIKHRAITLINLGFYSFHFWLQSSSKSFRKKLWCSVLVPQLFLIFWAKHYIMRFCLCSRMAVCSLVKFLYPFKYTTSELLDNIPRYMHMQHICVGQENWNWYFWMYFW